MQGQTDRQTAAKGPSGQTAGQRDCCPQGRADTGADERTAGQREGLLQRGRSERIDCFNIVCSVLWARLALSTRPSVGAWRPRRGSSVYGGYLCGKAQVCPDPFYPGEFRPPLTPLTTPKHPVGNPTLSRRGSGNGERGLPLKNGQRRTPPRFDINTDRVYIVIVASVMRMRQQSYLDDSPLHVGC